MPRVSTAGWATAWSDCDGHNWEAFLDIVREEIHSSLIMPLCTLGFVSQQQMSTFPAWKLYLLQEDHENSCPIIEQASRRASSGSFLKTTVFISSLRLPNIPNATVWTNAQIRLLWRGWNVNKWTTKKIMKIYSLRHGRRVQQNTSRDNPLCSILSRVQYCVISAVDKSSSPVSGRCALKSGAKLISLKCEEQSDIWREVCSRRTYGRCIRPFRDTVAPKQEKNRTSHGRSLQNTWKRSSSKLWNRPICATLAQNHRQRSISVASSPHATSLLQRRETCDEEEDVGADGYSTRGFRINDGINSDLAGRLHERHRHVYI